MVEFEMSKNLGFGVSACATCDGFSKIKKLLWSGGGNGSKEAMFLTKFASR